jgi:dihydroorotate dehydrogenase
MYASLRSLLFKLPPEQAHKLSMKLLTLVLKTPYACRLFKADPKLLASIKPIEKCGLSFPNPVGLAAGFDKDASYLHSLAPLGFGFIEIGTLTPLPQKGNPRPRLFRLPADMALVNRMGFNNEGAFAATNKLKNKPYGLIVGGNIGKNKDTSNEDALSDYLKCHKQLHPYVDYFVVNVSSPNTPGLRALQGRDSLKRILDGVQEQNLSVGQSRPVLLKIAPDLLDEQIVDTTTIVKESGIDGMIATNTTIDRKHLKTPDAIIQKTGTGGLSGLPLQKQSRHVLSVIKGELEPKHLIISSGGIMDAEEAMLRLQSGADLVQLYTGFIYKGPQLITDILKAYKADFKAEKAV